MKKIFTILFIGSTILTYSQNILSGKVTDTNDEPVIGADIYLPQIHKGTVSNNKGEYELQNLPKGKIDVVVAFIGYKTLTETIDINGTTTKDFIIQESVFKMDEVIVSTPFNKLQSHNVMKVESKKITTSSLGASNLTEKISSIPGVTSISTGNGIGKPVIRGLSGNRVLVYTQGIRYENQQFGEKHGLGIDDNGIENVEVIKGPASLLYGSDAMGGVIYLVPEKFESSNKTSANLNSSYQTNTLGLSNSLGVKSTKNNFKFLARGTYNTQSDYLTGDDIRVTNSRFNDKDFKTGVGYENSKIKTEIRYNYNLSNNGITHDIEEQNTSKKMQDIYQKIINNIISAKNNIYLKTLTLKTDLGFTNHKRNLFNGSIKTVDMNLNTFNYNLNAHLLNTGDIETIFGVQGMYQTNKNNIESIFLPDATTVDFGVFATSNYDFNKNTLQLGLRYDSRNINTKEHGDINDDNYFAPLDKNLNSFTGAVGIRSDISEKMISRVNLALGFRAPNLSELTSNGFHEGRYEVGNNNLNNEKNFQVDANIEYSAKSLELFINGFLNKINNYIYLEPSGETINGFDVFTYSQNDSKLYGGEIGLHLHPTHYQWLHLKSSGEYVRGKIDNGGNLPRIPGFTIKNNIKIDFNNTNSFKNSYVELNNKNVFEQTKISNNEDVGESYTLFDIGIGSNITLGNLKTKLFININNLFDKNYIDHLSVLKEENIANQGRNIIFGVNFNI